MNGPPLGQDVPASVKRQIDRICDELERAWKLNGEPRIEEYLNRVTDGRSVLLFELVKLEAELRRAAGDPVGEVTYRVRFPDDADTIKRAFAILAETRSMKGVAPAAHQDDSGLPRSEPTSAIAVGDKIGKYTVQRKVGQGGFGIVYLARHPQLDIDVAIKIPRSGRFRGNLEIESFLEDARHAASLKHPGIVTVHDVDQHDGLLFIVQEFLAGGDLKKALDTQAYAAEDAARLIAIVADAVAHAHKHGVYHRDLKPANILLDESGQPRVADFGLALRERSRRLHKGEICGTPPYMAPEQVRGEAHRIDGRCDVWGIGVILYEMLVARQPFSGENNGELFDHILYTEPLPPRQMKPELPDELQRICLKCLAKRMVDRYATANDLAGDLRNWLAESTANPDRAAPASESQPRKIVPKFLRSFDQEDRDFFLELLAGPKDREGLPDSIRFWKTRIEQRDADRTFPVGLLYGPSGCGKSSLVKAGLLPQLGSDVVQVYVEATPDETELRLLKELRKRFPGSPKDVALPEMLETIREGPSLPAGQKLLIVFDQFEQWLHAHNADSESQLVQALRQCDGGRVQTLLMVRDDFWMGATRFLQELEIELVQGHNLAAVDRFDLRHASKVLRLFGQAYGAFPDALVELSREQQIFVNESVKALAEDSRVVCIRLALFAHMVRAKPWTPATLKEAGGAEGIAVSFLDETFNSREASPKHRLHAAAIQRVLQQLLPVSGIAIKGQMKSRDELRAASQCREPEFDQVLGILNDELGLITPTDPLGETLRDDDTSPAESAGRFYQLTHDYLVPALRQWLTRNQRATRHGRAQLLLTEQAEAWNLKSDPRHLPTLVQWIRILCWTKRVERTASQQRMLQVANRRVLSRASVAILGIAVLLMVGYSVNGRIQANSLYKRLRNADTTQVADIVPELRPYRQWLLPLLVAEIDAQPAAGTSPVTATSFDRQRHLNLALGLAELNPSRVDHVLDLLAEAPIEHLEAVSHVLQRYQGQVEPRLWPRFAAAAQDKPRAAMSFGAVLATISPHDDRWPSYSELVSHELAASRPTQATKWIELYQPCGESLAPGIVEFYRGNASEAERANLVDAIAAYTTKAPVEWAAAVEEASQTELKTLLSASGLDKEIACGEMLERLQVLAKDTPQADPVRAERLSDESQRKSLDLAIQDAEGILDDQFVMVQAVPQASFADLDSRLSTAGYRATCVRPYFHNEQLLVAAAWRRAEGRSEIRWNLQASEVTEIDLQLKRTKMHVLDFASYRNTERSEPKWVAVWGEADEDTSEVQVFMDTTLSEHNRHVAELPKQGFTVERFDVREAADGSAKCSAIWKKTSSHKEASREELESFTDFRYVRAFGDLSPGHLQTDCRFRSLSPHKRDRLGFLKHLARNQAEADDSGNQIESDQKMLSVAKYFSAMGDFADAREVLVALFPRWHKSNPRIHEYLGILYARSANKEKLPNAIKACAAFGAQDAETLKPGMLDYLQFRADLLAGDATKVAEQLKALELLGSTSPDVQQLLARAYALAASEMPAGEYSAQYSSDAIGLLRDLVSSGQLDTPETLVFDVDFDGIRDTEEFAKLLAELGFHWRFHAAYRETAELESRQCVLLNPQEHLQAAKKLRREKFWPQTVSVQVDEQTGAVACCSVWHREVISTGDRIRAERRKANLILALASFDNPELLREYLFDANSHDIRSHLTTRAPDILPPDNFVEFLRGATKAREKQAILLALGGFSETRFSPQVFSEVRALVEALAFETDAGLRNSAVWCLRQWAVSELPTKPSEMPTGAKPNWRLNPVGQVMIELEVPSPFLMGSPFREPNRDDSESLYWARTNRSRYALAAEEVTIAQFQEFLRDEKVKRYYASEPFHVPRQDSPSERCAVAGTRWRDAALFCQWLSEQDQDIDASQFCYPDIWDANAKATRLPTDYRERLGYRLPTEIEWEWAARASTLSARHCGHDARIVDGYEWYSRNAAGQVHSPGRLRPNDFGFFDLLGNVSEWCDDLQHPYRRPLDGCVRTDAKGNSYLPDQGSKCVVRGGNYTKAVQDLRSANRWLQWADYHNNSLGFRPARTLPADNQR